MTSITTLNADLAQERQNATINVPSMKLFLGELTYLTLDNYHKMQIYRKFRHYILNTKKSS